LALAAVLDHLLHIKSTAGEFRMRDGHLFEIDPDAVLTFQEWCLLNGLTPATGDRIRRSGKGPKFVRLSTRRLGVTRRENRRWQDSRTIKNTETAAA
jgi:hypothetical protein